MKQILSNRDYDSLKQLRDGYRNYLGLTLNDLLYKRLTQKLEFTSNEQALWRLEQATSIIHSRNNTVPNKTMTRLDLTYIRLLSQIWEPIDNVN